MLQLANTFLSVFLWKFFNIVKALPCLSLDANKALSFTSCFISISATRLVLYIM